MKIVVLTCDKYTWLVPVFFHFFNKNWPDNPYQTEIITETDWIDGSGLCCYPRGKVFYTKGISWSSGILNYLDQSKEDQFILMPEDYIIKSPVDTSRVEHARSLCKGNVGCVRLNAPDKYFKYTVKSGVKGFSEYPLDKLYSSSMQTAIWQKAYLRDLLRHKENAWDAEIKGSKRLAGMKDKWRILWTTKAIIDYEAGGFMVAGRPRISVVKWTVSELVK